MAASDAIGTLAHYIRLLGTRSEQTNWDADCEAELRFAVEEVVALEERVASLERALGQLGELHP